jgi:hypothetical protein
MIKILAAAAVLAAPCALRSQSLDVGGVEISLGGSASEAQRALAGYRVRYFADLEVWWVDQQTNDGWESLGHFGASQGRVSYIAKEFSLRDELQTARRYRRARTELERRGGSACALREVSATDASTSFETTCGVYRLLYNLPSAYEGQPVAPSLYLSVGSPNRRN